MVKILGYIDTDKVIRNHVEPEDKKSFPAKTAGYSQRGRPSVLINESGFYSIILSSKLESAKNLNTGLHLKCSHPPGNMGSTNCSKTQITIFLE